MKQVKIDISLIQGASHAVLNLYNHFVVALVLLPRDTRLPIDDVRMSVELIQRRNSFVGSVHTCTTFFIPPLIASPNFALDCVVVSFDVLFENKRLPQVKQLSLAACGLRVTSNAFILIF
jgi:hypothetical protein